MVEIKAANLKENALNSIEAANNSHQVRLDVPLRERSHPRIKRVPAKIDNQYRKRRTANGLLYLPYGPISRNGRIARMTRYKARLRVPSCDRYFISEVKLAVSLVCSFVHVTARTKISRIMPETPRNKATSHLSDVKSLPDSAAGMNNWNNAAELSTSVIIKTKRSQLIC